MPTPRPLPPAEGKLGAGAAAITPLAQGPRAGQGAVPRPCGAGLRARACRQPHHRGGLGRTTGTERTLATPPTSISTSPGGPCLPQPSPVPRCAPFPPSEGSRAAAPRSGRDLSAAPPQPYFPPPRQAPGTYPRSPQPSAAAVVAGRTRKRGLK